MSTQREEVYLGDGLYASFDGYQIVLRAPRLGGSHYVALEPKVYQALLDFVKGLSPVTVEPTAETDTP